MNTNDIGKKIRERRKELGMTLDELARAVGVSKQTIFRYEDRTIENIPIDKLHKIAEKLNVSVTYLLDLKVEVGYEDFIALKEKEGFKELIAVLKEMDSEKIKKLTEMAKII